MEKRPRREVILDAVIELLAARGLEGVTHRAVDEIAGLPAGSSTYYFPKKTGLLIEASRHLARLLEKDCDELQVGFADKAAKEGVDAAVEYVCEALAAYADDSRGLFLARMELTLAASRRDDLSDVGRQLSVAAQRPIEFFLRLISGGKADVPVKTCASLIDGMMLMYATGQAPRPTKDQVSTVFRSIL